MVFKRIFLPHFPRDGHEADKPIGLHILLDALYGGKSDICLLPVLTYLCQP